MTLQIQWTNVSLRQSEDSRRFTFQATLKSNGDVVFAYRSVPFEPVVDPRRFPAVVVGLSDSYNVETLGSGGNSGGGITSDRKLVEYHKLTLARHLSAIVGGGGRAVIHIEALPTCNRFKSCWECTTHNTGFDCMWCPAINACSDRHDDS